MNFDDINNEVNNRIEQAQQLTSGIDAEELRKINKETRARRRAIIENEEGQTESSVKAKEAHSLTTWIIAIGLCIVAYLVITNF